ncbi:uncharacterized protein LOC126824592 isoform X2 [Patella vulgata]|uniref:uncharacterized protein LOC126824592 isoform X2 n=1 Tax=Patella vulgata TaxID=6465 RepID=UPI00217F3B78|nr:uncharacterized protein LOC126824592 isoform X2 [Patella vulgata]
MGDIGELLSQYFVRLASFQGLINDNQASDSGCQQTRVGNNKKQTVSISARTSFIKLARAGFYYAGTVEGIQCFVCKSKARYNNWHNESPVAVHRILNPCCPFLKSESSFCSSENNICNNSTTIQSPTTDGLISNHCCTNSQQPDNPTQLQEPSDSRGESNDVPNLIRPGETPPNASTNENTTPQSMNSIRRNLFSTSPTSNQSNVNVDDNSSNQINESTYHNNIRSRSRWSDHVEEYTGGIMYPRIGDTVFNAYESFRILTFPNPQDAKAEEWSVNGFVHIGNNNVQCVYCAAVTSYQEQLNIRDVHEKISPKGRYYCPMVSGIDIGNVSRKLEELVRKKLIDKNNRPKNMKNNFPVLHPQFRKTKERLASFEHWPKQYKPTKLQLVESGFFHTGVVTKVVCFCCGISVRDWEPAADTWQQHALISPTCSYIKLIKGEEFIQQMAAIQQLVEVDSLVTEPVTSIGELIIPDPYPPTLNTTLLAAYSTCGRYPSVDMLKAAVLADGELKKHVDIIDLKDEQLQTKDKQLDNLDQVMTVKDQHYKATVASLNQHHNIIIDGKEQQYTQQLNQASQQLNQASQQLNHKDQQLNQASQQLNQASQQLNQASQQLNHKDQQLNHKDQQLNHYRCTKRQLRQHIREKDDHIENLSNRLQTAVDRHKAREDNLQQVQFTLQQQIQTQIYRHQTELDTRTAQLQAEIQKYEEELSNLVTEFTRLRSTVNNRENQPDPVAINQPDPEVVNPDRCLICLSETRVVLFRPCKHVCCCTNCAPHFMDAPCPVCRTHVQDWEIVFLS